MRICGVDIKGSQARLAIIEGTGESFAFVEIDPRKVELDDDESSVQVRSFAEVFQSLVRDQKIDHLAIKKRKKKGEFAGGTTTFKIEGILQLLNGCEVHLLAPTSIAASVKKVSLQKPDGILKYQEPAFETAVVLLRKLGNG
jgi:hypothetical protein